MGTDLKLLTFIVCDFVCVVVAGAVGMVKLLVL